MFLKTSVGWISWFWNELGSELLPPWNSFSLYTRKFSKYTFSIYFLNGNTLMGKLNSIRIIVFGNSWAMIRLAKLPTLWEQPVKNDHTYRSANGRNKSFAYQCPEISPIVALLFLMVFFGKALNTSPFAKKLVLNC